MLRQRLVLPRQIRVHALRTVFVRCRIGARRGILEHRPNPAVDDVFRRML